MDSVLDSIELFDIVIEDDEIREGFLLDFEMILVRKFEDEDEGVRVAIEDFIGYGEIGILEREDVDGL